jgi:hypothetical protein
MFLRMEPVKEETNSHQKHGAGNKVFKKHPQQMFINNSHW